MTRLAGLIRKSRGLCCLVLLCLLAGLALSGCGQGVRVQPKGQVQTSIGVGR